MPFFTDIDSRAAIKGSRDPLGAQPVWMRFGRRVVGNLTTVSTSVLDFATLLIGCYLVERVAARDGPGLELSTFLRWEQLAAYARARINADVHLRGTERVQRTLEEGGGKVTISAASAHQILSNQKTYGIWGLYTVPARASGLVAADAQRLTPIALELVESAYLPILADGGGKDARIILDIVSAEQTPLALDGRDRGVAAAVARALRSAIGPAERGVYERHLRDGGPEDEARTHGDQARLAGLLRSKLSEEEFAWSPAYLKELSNAAAARGSGWRSLAENLDRIRVCESVLAPANSLFGYLLAFDGRPIDAVVAAVRENWGAGLRSIDVDAVRLLQPEFESNDSAAGDRWIDVAAALARGRWGDAIELLVAQNAAVMQSRGGSAWVALRTGSLDVRFIDEEGDLPARDAVADLWHHPYFVESLRTVTRFLSAC